MEWEEYCRRTQDTAVYPEETKLEYLSLGLANEAGEVAGLVKKRLRGDFDKSTIDFYAKISKELGDVAWYLAQLSFHYDRLILEKNLAKLADRKVRGVLKGSGDDR